MAVLLVVALVAVAQVAAQGECSASSPCPDTSNCCSQYGYCGTGDAYCGTGCINGPCTGTPTPPSPPGGAGWSSFFTEADFNSWFPSRNAFYTYQAFTDATATYSTFGTSGSTDDQKREIAAFFGNVQQESGGLQYINEIDPPMNYCQADNTQYPCAPGKSYYGRGPIQLSWNYNYGACGDALNLDLLANPDQVSQNSGTAFKTALWFWMTSGCHGAILGSPPSFASTNRIINSIECGHGFDQRVENRVNAYVGFCQSLGVDPGTDLRC